MMTFNEYLEEKYPEFYLEAKKTGLLGKVLHVAKNMPLTLTALAAGATAVGLSKQAEKRAEIEYHEPEVKKYKDKLPPLKPLKSKIVSKIEDAGTV